jgi:hypothetical protein
MARGKRQEGRSKRQEARGKKQEARGKSRTERCQETRGKRQEARAEQRDARRQEAVGFLGLGVQTTKFAEKAGEQGDAKRQETGAATSYGRTERTGSAQQGGQREESKLYCISPSTRASDKHRTDIPRRADMMRQLDT